MAKRATKTKAKKTAVRKRAATKKKLERKVVWKPGYRKSHLADAEEVYAELEQLRARAPDHDILPEDIVEMARDASSSAHNLFEWDVTEAARKYWVQEARELVRAVHVKFVDDPDKDTFRRYELVPDVWKPGRSRPYKPVEDLLVDPDTAQSVLYRVISDLQAFRRKWAHLNELHDLIDSIDSTQQQLRELYDSMMSEGVK